MPDFERYVTNRNLRFSFDDITAGPKANNWAEVIRYLDVFLKGDDQWEAQRKKICNRFNFYKDFNSSERVYGKIVKNIVRNS